MSEQAATEAVAEPVKEKRWGARSIASLLIFILAAVLTIPALVGHWGHRTIIDSDRYIETVGPLIDQPEVQQALATTVTDAVVAQVDTESQVDSLLTTLFPNAGFTSQLAGPIAAGVNSLIGEVVTKFVASEQFATVWVELNKAAQKGIVLVLEGKDGGVVSLQGDDLVLDTTVALQTIQQYLVDSGITVAANITIPDSDREIVLANAPGLAQIRTIYGFTAPILQWLPLLLAVMFGASILLARRRARTTVATGIVFVVSGVVLLMGLDVGQTQFNNQLAGTPWESATDAFWNTLLDYLVTGTQALVALGVVLILAGWFGGRTRIAQLARGQVTTGLGELRGRMFAGGNGPLPTSTFPYVLWIVYGLGVLLLLVSSLMSVSTVLWISALVAGLITVAQLLAGSDGEPESGGLTTTSTPVTGSTVSS